MPLPRVYTIDAIYSRHPEEGLAVGLRLGMPAELEKAFSSCFSDEVGNGTVSVEIQPRGELMMVDLTAPSFRNLDPGLRRMFGLGMLGHTQLAEIEGYKQIVMAGMMGGLTGPAKA